MDAVDQSPESRDQEQAEEQAAASPRQPATPISPSPAVRVEAVLAPRLNLADFQNAVPLIRELIVVNESADDLQDLELHLSAVPAFLVPRQWRIDLLRAGQQLRLSEFQVQLDGPLFSRLTEAEQATVMVTVTRPNPSLSPSLPPAPNPPPTSSPAPSPSLPLSPPEPPIAEARLPVELLARDQWGGLSTMPEMLAAFAQPNEAYIEKLLRNAADILEISGQNPSLNGYGSGPKHAWAIVSAIWTAICNERIAYALPPASFETRGQKVRGPARIAESRLGACLDLALLFASVLEQAGLHPLLVLERDHAYVGTWLRDETFQTAVVDDIAALRKRIQLKELIVFETTLITQRPLVPSFGFAIETGRARLSEAKEEAFELCIDVQRARLQRIRPLSGNANPTGSAGTSTSPAGIDDAGDGATAGTDTGAGTAMVFQQPDEDDFIDGDLPEPPEPHSRENESPADRLVRWQRKLLDLSLRNNLLNFKSRKAVTLEAPDPARLEDLLAEGHNLKLLPRTDLMEGRDPRSRTIHDEREQEDSRRERAREALERKEVFLKLEVEPMEAMLVDLYRTARSTLQEGGSNTLYLAFGFLVWTRDKIAAGTDVRNARRYRAPLLMLPVTLERRSARSGFTLTAYDDAPQFNPTLLEMLRQDFRLDLGIRDEELVHEEGSLDVAGLLRKVSKGIKDIAGWEVTDDVVLSTFSFAKYLMWKDLRDRSDELKQSPVVRHLIDSPRASYPSGTPFPEPRRLDAELLPQATFCPLPHDSSQLAAVVSAVRGKDFVLIGPPGTGKSQTIANLIAQCLAERKRVLFVSEKMAALDVVYRRLRDIGLGEFCLELHSSKARKTEVLSQLKHAWEAQGEVDPETWKARAEQLSELRGRLNGYVERLHHRHRNGLTAFEAIGKVTRNPDSPTLRLRWPSADSHDGRELQGLHDLAAELDTCLQPLVDIGLQSHALSHIRRSDWSPRWASDLKEAATALFRAGEALDRAARQFIDEGGLLSSPTLSPLPLTRPARTALEMLARILPHAHGRNWRFILRPDAETIAQSLIRGAGHLKQYRDAMGRLPAAWPRETIDSVQAGLRLIASIGETRAALSRPWPETVCADVEKAADNVAEYREHEQRLSVRYRPEALRLELKRLRQDWASSQKGIWPFKTLRRRTVEKALHGVTEDEAEPTDIGADLEHLARMRACRSALRNAEALGAATGGLWQDLKTDLDRLLAARRCQLAITRALKGQTWEDEGLELVASGQCGETMAEDLKRLRTLARLQTNLGRLDPLATATAGIWSGLETDTEVADAIARLQLAVHSARDGRAWSDEGFQPIDDSRAGLQAIETLRTLRELKAEGQRLDVLEQQEKLGANSEGLWAGLNTALDEVDMAVRACKPLRQAMGVLTAASRGVDSDKPGRIDLALAHLLGEGNALLGPRGAIGQAAAVLKAKAAPFEEALGRYLELWQTPAGQQAALSAEPARGVTTETPAGSDAAATQVLTEARMVTETQAVTGTEAIATARAVPAAPADSAAQAIRDAAPAAVTEHCRTFLALLPRLPQWCGWLRVREHALATGLAPLVAAIEAGWIEPGRVHEAFEIDYCRWWLETVVDGDEVLRTFLSNQHERRIHDFRALSDTFTDLTRQWVRAQLCAGIPSPKDTNLGSRNSEWGLLNREFQKKRAHLPLRELMSRTPTAVATLTPCLLMSPLSIAQYLPANTGLFDVVVFDEASQIPVWDAIGAMARGKQVIMVGDPKQLPPTNFFDRAESDDGDGDFDVEGDMESILDECLGANIPTISLDWHYRSRHESLIAFSNRQYYENKLITFPSPVTDDRAVSFHLVGNGIYEKGSSRTNPNEARSLVGDLVARLKSPGFKESKLTIGVVTFNSQQQGLIEDLLDAARRDDPALEHHFQQSLLEPIFVKNLENVQGDERDIMYFSLTYGPTLAGTVSMNFGPLNKQGGERRLNVAVTRARQELRVFSSLRPDQIDLSRTQAIGVRHLKHFMEFAQRGPRAFAEAVSGSVGGYESPFEEAVAIALGSRGWQVHPQVGVSGFRIDLGVIDEDAPGRYLAGVECDGATYHRSATAQDRDKVREQVLRGLGWSIVRIWSTDWWRDPAGTAERVDGQLRELLVERREAREAAAAADAAEAAEAAVVEATSIETDTPGRPEERANTEAAAQPNAMEHSRVPETIYANGPLLPPRSQVLQFQEVDLTAAGVGLDPEAFFELRYDDVLATLIDHAVRNEGPILERVLSRRIARVHGWLRTGARIHERVMQIALARQRYESDEEERCFWPAAIDAVSCRFRHPRPGESRDVDDIPRAELVALAREIAGAGRGIGAEAGVEAMLRHIGMRRARAATKEKLAVVWDEANGMTAQFRAE